MSQPRRSAARPLGAAAAVLALTAALVGGTTVAAHADELAVTDYAGLAAALNPASPLTEPRTIVLGADIVATASGVLAVTADTPIALDLSGHDLDLDGAADDLAGSIALNAGADLTITDTTASPGTLTAAGAPRFAGIRTTGASLTIEGSAIVDARSGSLSGGVNQFGTGAGIGGDGGGEDGGSVTIGGTAAVTATGGGIVTDSTWSNYAGTGAGIGGGGGDDSSTAGGAGGTVVIRDRARVTAVGGDIAAGLGSHGSAGAGIGGGGGGMSSGAGAGDSVAIEGAAAVDARGGSAHGEGDLDVGGGGAGIGAGGTPDTVQTPASGGTASLFVLAGLTTTPGTGWAENTGAAAGVTQTLPEITAVSPAAGIPGDALTIAGWGLGFATEVTVGGVAASFSVVDDTELTATVPVGSGRDLAVAVTIAAPDGDPSYTVTMTEAFSYQTPPTAGDVIAAVDYDSLGTAVATDVTSPGLPVTSVAVAAGATHGTATVDGLGFVYTPNPGYSGPDSFTYTATNRAGTSAPAAVSVTVAAPVLAISPATLPGATAGTAYAQTLTATGGAAPYRYAVTAGALPDGLELAPDGRLGGTPTKAGTFSFAVTIVDSGTGTPGTATAEYRIVVAAASPLAGTGSDAPLALGGLAAALLLGGAVALSVRRRSTR